MKKQTLLILILAIILSVFSGCGVSTPTTTPATTDAPKATVSTETSATATATDAPKKKSIHIYAPGNVQEFPKGLTKDDNFIINYWREKSGYDITFDILPLENGETKLNVMFNSGEVEGIAFSRDFAKVGPLAEAGLTIALDEYMAKSSFFSKFAESQIMGKVNGKQYAAVIPTDGINIQAATYVVRKDLMTSEPKSFDEFNKMLQQFKSEKLVPMALSGSPDSRSFSIVQGMFGIQNNFSIRNGKIVYNRVQPEVKEYLKYVQDLYKNGMIVKDFLTLNEQATQEMYLSGKAAMIGFGAPWPSKALIASSDQKGFVTRFLDYPSGVNGKPSFGAAGSGPLSLVGLVSANVKDPQAIVDFLDFLIQPDVSRLTSFGIEGEHYTLVNGKPAPTEKSAEISWGVYYRNIFMPEDWYPVYGVAAGWAEYYYPCERSTVGSKDPDPVFYMPVNAEYNAMAPDLQTKIVSPYFSKVVLGEASLDNFDAYVKEWLDAGGQAMLDYYNKLYMDLGSPVFEYKSYLPTDHPEYTGKYLFGQ